MFCVKPNVGRACDTDSAKHSDFMGVKIKIK